MKLESNDPILTAFALGELDDARRAEVDSHLQSSPALRAEIQDIRELVAQLTIELQKEPQPGLAQLQRIAIESESRRIHRQARRIPWTGLAVAACLVASIGAYLYFHRASPLDALRHAAVPDDSQRSQEARIAPKSRIAQAPSPTKENSDADDAVTQPDAMAEPVPELATDGTRPLEGTAEEGAAPPTVDTRLTSIPTLRPNPSKLAGLDDVSWINARVQEMWSENKIKPSGPAADGEFIRRAFLDIVGRIPPADETAAFIKSREKDKKAKIILSLVNSEDYASYWATIWSNLLIGRRPGRNVDKEALQKYLRDSFAQNKPWNTMVYELITATGGSTTKSGQAGVPFNGATNFLLAHMNDGNVPATAFTTRLFLGVHVQCTQCHDHPFNDRTQEAFWGINAFFQKMRRQEHNEVDDTGRRNFQFAELQETPASRRDDLFVRYEKRSALMAVTPPRLLDGRRVEPTEDESVNLREELARFVIAPDNQYFAQAIVNRMWSHFLGRGIIHPSDDLGTHNPASNPELLGRLARNFQESNYDLKRLVAWITLSLPYSLSSETNSTNRDDDQYCSHYPLKQMSPEQFFDSLMVATKANRVGAQGWEQADKMKDELQGQFTAVFANDENTEADTFNGTIPQALLLMNGGIMQKAISKERGSYLRERVDEVVKKKARGADVALLNDLYLAALSRYPSPKEKTLAGQLLQDTLIRSKDKDPIDAYQDIFWALLNSSEFVLNH